MISSDKRIFNMVMGKATHDELKRISNNKGLSMGATVRLAIRHFLEINRT